MSKIFLENICKYFGSTKAVEKLNINVKEGEFMALLGPSGCGKSTTLRLIAGLEKPTRGNIYFDDRIVNDLEPKERAIAMVFQDYALYPHMSVYDNMALCLKVDKIPKNEIVKRVTETAKILNLEQLLNRKPGELSGGQQQRVALGRAIIRKPSVFLLDEPLSNLDAVLRINMRAELKKLQEKLKTTMIYVTHDQEEAMIMADRVAIIKDGKVLQINTPRRIYDQPANKFIAGFIGSPQMNFLECNLVEKSTATYLNAGKFSVKVPSSLRKRIKAKERGLAVVMGVRPEDVLVSLESQRDFLEVKVYFFQQMGNIGYVNLEMGNNIITAMVNPNFEGHVGENVFIKFNESRLHIFDKRTEDTII
ncbi:MAG TPA: glycerol-3-phosphate ABC transporter ATP-binding protein [Candidatus Atribacteria bacterium]|jgi:multiple sugar transport system ATP-binding protein|nr:glycerol-3-phosphate ABC transporter ATP-binding protein [Candidatus Atribacteria bacterium]